MKLSAVGLPLILASALALPTLAQQPATPTTEQPAPRRRRTPPPTTEQPAAPAPAAPSTTEPEPSPRSRQMEQEQQQPSRTTAERAPAETGGAGGATNTSFRFDMKETSSSVTHHTITAGGRTLPYTA